MYHRFEQHISPAGQKLNWLRASVLGANDGIVSIAGLVFGVAGAAVSSDVLLMTGIAGIVAGALSMAVGEYVSVSSSRDAEQALLLKEKKELEQYPQEELAELTAIYEKKGLSKETAALVAAELTAKNAFAAHVEAELKIDPENISNPFQAGLASSLSFTAGAVIPLLAIALPPEDIRIGVAIVAVIFSLVVTGVVSARIGGANPFKAAVRVAGGGIIAMAITYGIGLLIGTSL